MAEVQRHPENVGQVLIQVQEDIKYIKDQISQVSDPSKLDLRSLNDALNRTQEGIKRNTEYVVSLINNEVSILPTFEESSRRSLRTQIKAKVEGDRPAPYASAFHDSPGEKESIYELERELVDILRPAESVQFHHDLTMKALLNPESIYNRPALNRSYGFVLPQVKPPRQSKMSLLSATKGPTVDQLAVLPKANRVNPSLPPPPIMEKDARKGILSLIERGLIPPAAELTLDPSPVHHKKAMLHTPDTASRKQLLSQSSARGEGSHYMASVKLDMSHDEAFSEPSMRIGTSDRVLSPSTIPPLSVTDPSLDMGRDEKSPQLRSVLIQSPLSYKKTSSAKSTASRSVLPLTLFKTPLAPLPPPATPARKEEELQQVVAAAKSYSFFIRSGRAPNLNNPEYASFHQQYLLQWGNILTVQNQLLKLLRNFSIPTAYVVGVKLAELAAQSELGPTPTQEDLLSVLDNQDEVAILLSTPGRRYMASDGTYVAATKIQATWRRYRNRIAYLEYRRQKWAAGVIAIAWIMHVQLSRMRVRLREIRKRHIDNYRARAKTLASEWHRISKSKRVIVHVPSLGYPVYIRSSLTNLNRLQNSQVGRLCNLADPNVYVIYVSPIDVLEDFNQYYKKLLGIRAAVDSGNPEEIADLSARFTIVVPDALSKFPTHNMCLASLLKYSPRTIKRIKHLISGRDALYLPGVVHKDDMAVADTLGIPLIGCEPDICHLYSSKSGSRRIFAAAGVQAPPGEHDVYTAQQLHELLARLICDNPIVTRWLLKMDVGFRGRGTAYIDIDKFLPCYKWMLRESLKYGERWRKRWAQDAAFTKILIELPDTLDNHMVPCDRSVHPTWVSFLDAFLAQGGIIDACPPAESITHLTVTMMIEPTGAVRMTSCGDQIHAGNPLQSFGVTMPQDSIDPVVLNDACMKIGEACKARGVMGHFSIDFVTFIDLKLKQQLWATDLKLTYSDQMAMAQIMLFLTGGDLDAARSKFEVPPPHKPKPGRFRKRSDDVPSEPPILGRYCALSTSLYHSNMAVVHYSVFFQMCRAHGIGFDIKERQGTIFTVVDSIKREEFGMLTIGSDLPGTLAAFARNLTIIHQEISAPNMQGKTNFKVAVDDIESILGVTAQNEKEDEDKKAKN